MINYGFIALAILAGTTSFFSPCSFPLLPTYMVYIARESGRERDFIYGVKLGFYSSLGMILVYGLLTIIQISVINVLTVLYSRVVLVLGILIILFGFLNSLKARLDLISRPIEVITLGLINRLKGRRSTFIYGVVYALSSLACSGPILFMIAALAVSSGFYGLFLILLTYLLTIYMMMIFFSGLSTYIGLYLSKYINKYMRYMDVLISILLIFSGIYIVAFELGYPLLIL